MGRHPAQLDSYLSMNYEPQPWGDIAPDTQEAQDAATASGESSDRAEAKIYLLLETEPATWEAILQAIKRVGVGGGELEFFQRYHPPHPPIPSASDQE